MRREKAGTSLIVAGPYRRWTVAGQVETKVDATGKAAWSAPHTSRLYSPLE